MFSGWSVFSGIPEIYTGQHLKWIKNVNQNCYKARTNIGYWY